MLPVRSAPEFSKRQNLCPAENTGISTLWFMSASLGLSENSGFRAELYFATSKCYNLLWQCFFIPDWKMQHKNCRKALKIEVWNCRTSIFRNQNIYWVGRILPLSLWRYLCGGIDSSCKVWQWDPFMNWVIYIHLSSNDFSPFNESLCFTQLALRRH